MQQRPDVEPHAPPWGAKGGANTAENSELQVGSHATVEQLCLAQWEWWPDADRLHDHPLVGVVVKRKLNTSIAVPARRKLSVLTQYVVLYLDELKPSDAGRTLSLPGDPDV